jgi:hypothetical protein
MVLRHDAAGVLAVGQPAHASLCGQFARAWGNARFAAVTPLAEVALAAEQHDIGWSEWELEPQFNATTGLPQGFTEVGLTTGTALWRTGPPRLRSQSRYAALLATMHGRRLYERIDLATHPTRDADAVTTLLAESRERERRLVAALRADQDPEAAGAVDSDRLTVNSGLMWAWDTLSLALLLDWAPHTLRSVPTGDGTALDIELRAPAPDGALTLAPWPFADPDALAVHTEGRRLPGRYASADELHEALEQASWETVRFTLRPARDRAPVTRG